MLSQDIELLAEHFAPYRHRGVSLEPSDVVAILAVLNGLQAAVWTLERQAIPAAAALPLDAKLPENVVRLFAAGGGR